MTTNKTTRNARPITMSMVFLVGVCLPAVAGLPTWTDPEPLNNNADTDSEDDWVPQLTTDGSGHWVAVWYSYDSLGGTIGTDRDILVARSSDNGLTWSDTVALNNNAATDAGADEFPQVTTDGAGQWVAVWYSSDTLDGTIQDDWDILVARSTDNGLTWTDPVALNSNAESILGSDIFPQVTTDGAGNWVAVWFSDATLDGTLGGEWDILVARSIDNGLTWTDVEPLNNNATTDTGLDQVPQVTTDGAGNWVAVWWSTDDLGLDLGTDQDILVARSTDNGLTWTDPQPLNNNAATDSGEDWYPEVTTDGAGHWVTVWYSDDSLGGTIGTDFDILVALSSDNGLTWTDPVALNNNAATDVGNDSWPQVTTDEPGNWVAVWEGADDLDGTIGPDADILMARSCDNGLTWTDPEALNNNAATDMGRDLRPQVSTDGAGNWVGVWYSNDDLGGTIGTDFDIIVARNVLTDCNANGIFDECEIAGCASSNPDCADCNGNEIPDECDIASGASEDQNDNGVPDECEPMLLSAMSCVTHGDAGEFCINLPLEPPTATEPRIGLDGDSKLVLTFDEPLDSALAEDCTNVMVKRCSGGIIQNTSLECVLDGSGVLLTITFPGLPDAKLPDLDCYTVDVSEVGATGDTDFVVRVLHGDANTNAEVDPFDSGYVLARYGCDVAAGDPDCFLADINNDGATDPLDSGAVLARFGNSACSCE